MTEWNVHMNDLYPVLNKLVTLRQRIQKTDIAALLMGVCLTMCRHLMVGMGTWAHDLCVMDIMSTMGS